MKPAEPSVKIAFPLDSQEWHGHSQERLWVTPIENGTFVLDNSPFYADGVSYLDTVSEHWDGCQLVFAEVIQRGGHSTYRIRLPPDKAHGYFFRSVYNLLQALEDAEEIEFDEGHYCPPAAEDASR